jgi:ABC-type nitrate/sulfonate/bicarbonate transport system permease component
MMVRRLRNAPWLIPLLFWVGALLTWEVSAQSGLISRLFFPAPSVIVRTLVQMIANGQLLVNLGFTLYRLTLGVTLGASLGLLLGLLMGWSRAARAIAGPTVAAIHPMPKLALLPLALILFGIGEQSKVVLIALTAFFPMLINSMAGVQQIDNLTLEVARHYGARGWTLWRRVLWPGSLPMTLTGLQLALNAALMITVAVELVTAREGLGAIIWLAWQTLRTAEMYATLLVIGSVGLISNIMLNLIARRLMPWQRKEDRI